MSSSSSSDRTPRAEPAEDTPLLSGGVLAPDGVTDASALTEDGLPKPKTPSKPLPKFQIFLLCYARVMEPIAFFSIFPFIAQMVQQNGNLADTDVGFYSGLIESLFSATQMCVLVLWGRLADRVGRKPVLLCSLIGMAIAPAMFGMATSIWQMILFRCIAGVFSGSSLIIRTMLAEHSTVETQAIAFSWFAFAGNLGIAIGPIIGGVLADPVQQYPNAFKGLAFFEHYPFALPGFAVAAISSTGAIVSAIFLKETLVKQDTNDGTDSQRPEQPSIWELVKAPGIGAVLWAYSHVMFLAFAFTALVPIVLFTPVKDGGLGFDYFQTSLFMASQGVSQALWLLIAFPILQYRLGTKAVLQICAACYPFFFMGWILVNVLLRDGSFPARVGFYILGPIVALIGPGISMAFTGTQLALNDASPSPQVLGTLNAIALTCSSGIRSVVPAVSTVIYAVGVRNQILWGHLAWVILIVLAGLLTIALKWLPESKVPAKQRKHDETES